MDHPGGVIANSNGGNSCGSNDKFFDIDPTYITSHNHFVVRVLLHTLLVTNLHHGGSPGKDLHRYGPAGVQLRLVVGDGELVLFTTGQLTRQNFDLKWLLNLLLISSYHLQIKFSKNSFCFIDFTGTATTK